MMNTKRDWARRGSLYVPVYKDGSRHRRYRERYPPNLAFAFVQAASNGVGPTGGTSIAATIDPGAGNMIAAVVTCENAFTLNSMTDNGTGGTWVIKRTVIDSANGAKVFSVYGYGWSVSPTTITANFSGSSQYRGISAIAFSGQAPGDPIDGLNEQGQLQTSPGTGTDGAKSGSGTQTPGDNNYLVFGGSVLTGNLGDGSSHFAAGTNFTEPANAEYQASGQISLSSEYWIQTTATPANASFTLAGGSDSHVTMQMIFRVFGSAGTDIGFQMGYLR